MWTRRRQRHAGAFEGSRPWSVPLLILTAASCSVGIVTLILVASFGAATLFGPILVLVVSVVYGSAYLAGLRLTGGLSSELDRPAWGWIAHVGLMLRWTGIVVVFVAVLLSLGPLLPRFLLASLLLFFVGASIQASALSALIRRGRHPLLNS
jgi:hypothetical protein